MLLWIWESTDYPDGSWRCTTPAFKWLQGYCLRVGLQYVVSNPRTSCLLQTPPDSHGRSKGSKGCRRSHECAETIRNHSTCDMSASCSKSESQFARISISQAAFVTEWQRKAYCCSSVNCMCQTKCWSSQGIWVPNTPSRCAICKDSRDVAAMEYQKLGGNRFKFWISCTSHSALSALSKEAA